ncbi:MAG: hypothetical protein KIT80_08330 [Chitinophagaceae bacterium]|nr:hypothetical protein [Chitinophagaceae bacterium]MCW5926902.1 hypothetical protein [Chitinophagaceae bacterium]
MKRIIYTLVILTVFALNAHAKIWRVNNTTGVNADFAQVSTAVANAQVQNGDTIYVEPGATDYNGFTLNKQLVIIGPGYFLEPGNTTTPYNPGLQAAVQHAVISSVTLGAGAAGSKFSGLVVTSILNVSAASNIQVERCYFTGYILMHDNAVTNDNITVRQCFFYNNGISAAAANSPVTNFIFENNILYGNVNSRLNMPQLTGSGNLVRNNTFYYLPSNPGQNTIANAYVANNIFTPNTAQTFTDCVIKNNLFRFNQTLPGTAVGNQVNLGAAIENVFTGGDGSLDSRVTLQSGSLASGAGVTISGYTPDAGAFGGTNPYRLSGIPAIPSVYNLVVPLSIPAGTNSMNITLSTRNNN